MRLLTVSTVLAIAVGTVSAQIPSGHFVVSALSWNSTSIGGLAIVHPAGAVPPVIVSGLTDDLTGFGQQGNTGANCVVYSDTDGFLIVGESTPDGDSVDLHQLLVVGGTVVLDLVVNVGTALPNPPQQAGVTQISMLSNGDAVFSYNGFDANGPLTGDGVALFNRNTQSVSAIPIAMPLGFINAVVVDEPNGLIYFGMWGQGTVWSAPLAGGVATQIAQVASSIWNLAMDEDDNILVCDGSTVSRVDVQSGLVTQTYATGSALAVMVEHSTADPIAFVYTSSGAGGNVLRLSSGSSSTIASSLLALSSGVTMVQSASEYGSATPGATDYAFRTFPGVGGLPIAGNQSYALQVDAANGSSNLGVLAASFAPGALQVLGIQLLVDPGSAIALGAFAAGTPITISLPPGLPPTFVYFQSIHLDAGNPSGLAATRGLRLTTIE